ncbi:25S rRNA adenine-N(1) methyltransferase [Phanerochaete sordida]|uniref:25S rRNA adenine-N(1) methyltransferase n=1 Tax=Phanerochaete sordida TaxID=48140 RepID=A0A9P3G1Z1_9APHY|nr:25S rRNA adenine-N(1) methyltransferase [Phanerochaete sordida]
MAKIRKVKRKAPVTSPAASGSGAGPAGSSSKPAATRKVIRRFHVLSKRQVQLRKRLGSRRDGLSADARAVKDELAAIEQELADMGGLEAYQKMSVIGQGSDRGGGSEKVLIGWLNEEGYPESLGKGKLRVLEVGALKPDNYASCSSWMNVTPIDLHSRHPAIQEQDFLLLDEDEHREQWDLISLSLVVNFVPEPKDRGRMLRLAHAMLKPEQYLFLALPLPCIMNSRYCTAEHIERLMAALSFKQVKTRWREGGKMAYWLFQKVAPAAPLDATPYEKKAVLRTGNDRNNFSIVL